MASLQKGFDLMKISSTVQLVLNVVILLYLANAYAKKSWPFASAAVQAKEIQGQASLGPGEYYKVKAAVPPLLVFTIFGVLLFAALSQVGVLSKIPVIGGGLSGRY
jgi:hypothetical protein